MLEIDSTHFFLNPMMQSLLILDKQNSSYEFLKFKQQSKILNEVWIGFNQGLWSYLYYLCGRSFYELKFEIAIVLCFSI
jgi:hypothetical protein